MARINVYEADEFGERRMVGWFDPDKSQSWKEDREWDGQNMVSVVAGRYGHEELWRTQGGRWLIQSWSKLQGVEESFRFVDREEAREWLIRCNHDAEEIERATGEPVEEERGRPGRPALDDGVSIKLLIPRPLLDRVDEAADDADVSRAAMIRDLLTRALG